MDVELIVVVIYKVVRSEKIPYSNNLGIHFTKLNKEELFLITVSLCEIVILKES